MALGSTSRVSVQYKPETVFGVTPAAGANYYDLRVTGESLDFAVSKTTSSEINATRSVSSQVATSASSSGGVQSEFSHGEYDRLLQSTMQSTFAASGTDGVLAVAATSAFTTSTITFGTATTHGVVAGQWFRMIKSGGTNTGKLFRASTSTAPTTTVITLDAGTPAIAEAAVAGYSLQASRLANGTTQGSFSIQRVSNDLSPVEYFVYRGMTPSKFSLNVASGSLTTCSFDFMGKDLIRFTGANNPLAKGITAAGALDTGTSALAASLTGQIHAGTTSTNCVLWASGSAITGTYIKSIKLDFDNTLGVQEAVCNLGAVGIRSGTINCTATMQLYFAEGAKFYTEFINNSNFEVAFSSSDSDGNIYVFTLPAANVATYKVNAGGKDTDLLVDVTFTALRDSVLNKVLVIDRCGSAVTL